MNFHNQKRPEIEIEFSVLGTFGCPNGLWNNKLLLLKEISGYVDQEW